MARSAGRAGLCADGAALTWRRSARVGGAGLRTWPARFDQPVSNISSGEGVLTQVDANTWTFVLPASAVGSQLVGLHVVFPGPDMTGSAMFFAHLAVMSQTVSDLRRTGSVVRARVRVPAQGTIRAYVRVNGKRRSAVVARAFSAAGERRLRLDVRRGTSGTAWLVTQYTSRAPSPLRFPSARRLESGIAA